jgi:hypothetical protein
MKAGAVVLAVIMLLVGAVFTGQGLGYIKGSFMTGDMHWFWVGIGLVAAALLLGAAALVYRPRRAQ